MKHTHYLRLKRGELFLCEKDDSRVYCTMKVDYSTMPPTAEDLWFPGWAAIGLDEVVYGDRIWIREGRRHYYRVAL